MNVTGILNDREIKALCEEGEMIRPFVPQQAGKPSYGLGSFGYDMRLGNKFLVPIGGINAVLDPIASPRGHFREIEVIVHASMGDERSHGVGKLLYPPSRSSHVGGTS